MKYRFLILTCAFLLISGLCLIIMSGCVNLGPDFQRPDSAIPIPETFQHAQTGPVAFDPQEEWWKAFGDPELNRFVEEVLERNLDIKTASSRILEWSQRHY